MPSIIYPPPIGVTSLNNIFLTGRQRTVGASGGGDINVDQDIWFAQRYYTGTLPDPASSPLDDNQNSIAFCVSGQTGAQSIASAYHGKLVVGDGYDYIDIYGVIWDGGSWYGQIPHLIGYRHKWRAILTLSQAVIGYPQQFYVQNGDWQYSPWYQFSNYGDPSPYPPEPPRDPYFVWTADGSGAWSFSESLLLQEALGMDYRYTDDVPFEVLTVLAATVSGNGSVNVVAPYGTFNCSVSGSFGIPLTGQQWLAGYESRLYFYDLGLHKALSAWVKYDDPTLYSQYPSINTSHGFAVLSGSPNSATLRWTGNDGTDYGLHNHPTQTPGDGAEWYLATGYGTAEVHFQPSWALQAKVKAYDYNTGIRQRITCHHRWKGRHEEPWDASGVIPWDGDYTYVDAVLGTFYNQDEGGNLFPYRYPADGSWLHSVYTTASDGGPVSYRFPNSTQGIYSSISAPGNYVLTGNLNIINQIYFPPGYEPGLVGDGGAPSHWFEPAAEWGDTDGTYIRGRGRRTSFQIHPEFLRCQIYPVNFPAATFQIDATHIFTAFKTPSMWQLVTGLDTAGSGTVQPSGKAVSFKAQTVPVLFGTQYTAAPPFGTVVPVKALLPIGYRYFNLVAHADKPGLRFRFCVGQVPTNQNPGVFDLPGPWRPEFAWDFVTGAAGQDVTFRIDLAWPDEKAVSSSSSNQQAIRWGGAGQMVDPSHWFDPTMAMNPDPTQPFEDRWYQYDGAAIWLELLDLGTYTFSSLTGFFDTTQGRTPIRLWFPLEGGKDIEQAAPGGTGGTDNDWLPPTTPTQNYGLFESDAALAPTNFEKQSETEDQEAYGNPHMLRLAVNGWVSMDLKPACFSWRYPPFWYDSDQQYHVGFGMQYQPLATLGGFWDRVFKHCDDSLLDTGVHVTVLQDPAYRARPLIASHLYTQSQSGQPFMQKPNPGQVVTFLGQLRTRLRWAPPRGYPGMGDIMNPQGGYQSLLQYTFEWIFRGEKIGWTIPGSPLQLYDNNTAVVVSHGTADPDGFFNLPMKYGVVFPLDNLTRTQQFNPKSSAPDVIPTKPVTYTTLGLLFNAYWVKGFWNIGWDSQGYAKITFRKPKPARTERLDVEIIDRYPSWLYPPQFVGNEVSLLRDFTWRTYLFHAEDEAMQVDIYNDEETAVDTTTDIEDGDAFSSPSFVLYGDRLEGCYIRQSDNTIRYAVSTDHGANWTVEDLPGEYDNVTFAHWRHLLVVLGYKDNAWNAIIGDWNPDSQQYDWADPAEMTDLTDPDGTGDLKVLYRDGPLEFAWRDSNGNLHISHCYSMPADGTGTWR